MQDDGKKTMIVSPPRTPERLSRQEDKAWEEVPCDLCGSGTVTDFVNIEEQRTKVKRPMKLVKCLVCGLVYLNPRPTPELIGEFYGPDYYAHTGMELRRRLSRQG